VAFLKRNRSHALLVEKTDRLYRNFRDYVTMDDLGVEIHFVKEGGILAPDSRSSDKFMHSIRVAFAKNCVDNLSEETKKGMLEKARQGIWPSYAPLGYRNVPGCDGKRTIEPDATLAPIITKLFELYATGRYAVRQMANTARELGLVYRKSGGAVPTSTVHKILRNRIYMGDFEFDGKVYRGTHRPLVSRELWDRVQGILDGRGSKKTHRVKERFAFTDLITCGHCGCAMVAEMKKGRYVYYHCTGYHGKCPERYTREEVLEVKFAELLRGISFSTEVLAWASAALRQSHADKKKFHDQALMNLHREYKRFQERIDVMYLDKLDGRVDAEFFDRHAQEWRAKQRQITTEINDHRAASACWDWPNVPGYCSRNSRRRKNGAYSIL
jgi:DNA invertase Pin-like site-specific DNA recombinase